MHTFVELVQDILTALNREDDSVLANIEDSIELTTTATLPHAVDTYLIYNKTVYKVTAAIATGDTLTPGTNITVANDIMSMISGATTEIGSLSNSKADKSTIAPVESTNTASKAYAVGEQLYYENVLYKVTAAIAQGDTLVVNTNIVAADKVSTQIQTLTNQVKDMNNVYGSKNLLPTTLLNYLIETNTASDGTWSGNTYTRRGITFTVNNDGSITINGTATANAFFSLLKVGEIETRNYKLSGCPSGGDANTYCIYTKDAANNFVYDTGDGAIANMPYSESGINIKITSGQTVSDLTFYPMLRLASITDDTYEPYAKTNQQLTQDTTGLLDNTEVNGAVNMLPNNATTQTINGITFTVNDDGTVKADGTATANADLDLNPGFIEKANVVYRLSGCPSGGSTSTWLLYERNSPNALDTGDGVLFSRTVDTTALVRIRVYAGQTVSNLTFKPMLTVPSYNGDYVPYAKSNKELTEDVENIESEIADLKEGQFALSQHNYSANTEVTISDFAGIHILIITANGNASNQGVYLIQINSSGSISQQAIIPLAEVQDSGFSISLDGTSCKFTNTTGGRYRIIKLASSNY